jgi:hypothetical protein
VYGISDYFSIENYNRNPALAAGWIVLIVFGALSCVACVACCEYRRRQNALLLASSYAPLGTTTVITYPPQPVTGPNPPMVYYPPPPQMQYQPPPPQYQAYQPAPQQYMPVQQYGTVAYLPQQPPPQQQQPAVVSN